MELQEAFDAGFEAVKKYVDDGFAALEDRLKALETRAPLLGEQGPAGKDGADGPAGERGLDGKDGVGLAGALIDRDGTLVVTLTDGTAKTLGLVIGKDGAAGLDGKDGADALGFDDLSIEFDGERDFKFVMVRGEARKEFGPYSMPVLIDRGVWREAEYKRGDVTSWGGSAWIAQRDTSDKPETSDAWRLAVKRGRDGRDGILKPPKPPETVKLP